MVRISQQQKEQLVEFMEMNPRFVNGTFCMSVKDRKKTWEILANDLNSMSSEGDKTLKAWQMSWKEQKKTVREKLAKINETLRTPRALHVKSHPLTPIEKRIAAIIGWSASKKHKGNGKSKKSGTTVSKRKPVRSPECSMDFQECPQQEPTSEASPQTSWFSEEDTVPKFELASSSVSFTETPETDILLETRPQQELTSIGWSETSNLLQENTFPQHNYASSPVSFTESPEIDFLLETRPQQELTPKVCSETSNLLQENTVPQHNSAGNLGSFTESSPREFLQEKSPEYNTAIKIDVTEPEIVIIEDNPDDFQEEHIPETIPESVSPEINSAFPLADNEIETSNQDMNEEVRPLGNINSEDCMQSASPSAAVWNDSSYESQSETFPERVRMGPSVPGVQQENSFLDALVTAQRETAIVLNRLANATDARNCIEQERNEIFRRLVLLLGSKVCSL